VILSAGATATPGILLRSGIGPRRAVERIGVDLVHDLPAVGARLLDHPGVAIFFRPVPGVQSLAHPLIQTVLRCSATGRLPNDLILQPGSVVPTPYGTLPLLSIMVSVGKPRGHGTIEYASASPHARPDLRSRLLLDPEDRARAVAGLELAVELAQSRAMRGMATFFFPPRWAAAGRVALERWIGRVCDSSYHPCGTVPMGGATDQRGRVVGVEGLIVADASLMPTIPSANTNLTALMIGERFGQWLKDGEL